MKTNKTSIGSLLLFLTLSVVSFAAHADKSRLEERLTRLFYWQMSQALDLSTAQEKQMTQVMDDISKRRLSAIDKRDQVFAKMNEWLKANPNAEAAKKTPPEVTALLAEYKQQLGELSKIDLEEQQKLQDLLGDLKLLKFYNERKIIIERVKNALNN